MELRNRDGTCLGPALGTYSNKGLLKADGVGVGRKSIQPSLRSVEYNSINTYRVPSSNQVKCTGFCWE